MTTLTKDEMIFAERMLHHFLAGKTPEEAARAVLDDDARIMNAVAIHRHQEFFSDFHGAHTVDRNPVATSIAAEITARVYAQLRA